MSKKLIFQNRKIQKIPSKTDHNNLSLPLFQISTQFLLSAYLDLGVYKKSPPPPPPPPPPPWAKTGHSIELWLLNRSLTVAQAVKLVKRRKLVKRHSFQF